MRLRLSFSFSPGISASLSSSRANSPNVGDFFCDHLGNLTHVKLIIVAQLESVLVQSDVLAVARLHLNVGFGKNAKRHTYKLKCYLAIHVPVPHEGVVFHGVPIGVELDLAVLGAGGRRLQCFP